jgi:glycosyltransferase involved in cell wall biosynthesis
VRVIYLHQYFNTPSMSGGTRSYEMARRLIARGHTVDMVTSSRTPKADSRAWTETETDGIRVHWYSVPYSNEMGYAARLWAFARFALASARRAASLRGDVVFATSTPLTIALPGAFAARRQRIPMVLEVRDLWPETPIAIGALRSKLAIAAARALERFAYSNSARVVALSPGMRDGVVRAGYAAERVDVIPNGADLELFGVSPEEGRAFRRRYEWLQDRPLVVYTGALGRVNGMSYLARIAAAALSRAPDLRFLIVGSGSEEGVLRRVATELGVLDRSLFIIPRLPKSEIPAVLSAADLATSFVVDLEALWLNSANKFFDALAAGRPVMINHGGWQAELLLESGAGIVVPPADAAPAAAAVLAFLGDPARVERARLAARRLAEEQFSREVLGDRLELVLRRAVEAGAEVRSRETVVSG